MYSNSVTTAGSRLLGNTNPIRPSGNPKSGRGPETGFAFDGDLDLASEHQQKSHQTLDRKAG